MSDAAETTFETKIQMASCENCAFFKDDVSYYGKETSIGECRRHSPNPLTVADETSPLMAIWPRVSYTDWCGDWMPRYEEDHPEFNWKKLI